MDLKSLAFWREGGLTYVDLVFWTGLLLYVFVYRRYADRIIPSLTNKNDSTPLSPVIEQESESASPSNAKPSRNKKQWKPTKTNYSHPYLAANLMGHTGKIMSMDCSNDGKYMVACAEDRTIIFWDIREIQTKGRKSYRINVEYDYATHVLLSPDNKAFLIHKYREHRIEVFKIDKKKDGLPNSVCKVNVFNTVHYQDIIGFDIACNGRYIMSCSTNNDIVIWSLKGEEITRVDTYMMFTEKVKISPCARYIVASGFVSEVRIWEVLFDNTGKFIEVVRAFELMGHSAGIYDFAFDAGTSHIATVSKDGTWRLYDTKIDYAKGEMVQFIAKGNYTRSSTPAIIALSPNAHLILIGTGNCMEIYRAKTGILIDTIEKIFVEEITGIKFHYGGENVFVTGENKIRIFNVEFY